MDSKELIRLNLKKSTNITLAKVEEMKEHSVVFPTPNGGAHTIWTLGHLAFIEGQIINNFMLGKPNPLDDWEATFDGPADDPGPYADVTKYPPFDEVLAKCKEMRATTISILEGLTEADLDQESANTPKGWESTFGTYRLCLQFVADHWLMHRGQLADARRAADIDRMWV